MLKVRSPYPGNRFLTDLRLRGPHACYGDGGGSTFNPALRKTTEAWENKILCKFAARNQCEDLNQRRVHQEKRICQIRTRFARDRDRIIHSRYFMLLTGKTQVFPVLYSFKTLSEDHFMKYEPIRTTRLFHVLRVAQLARTIGRCLRLNMDLIEAIALPHDIGHVPFGHAGERSLQAIQKDIGPTAGKKFMHEVYGLFVVDHLEKMARTNFNGLNLTLEVRDGIVHHCGEKFSRIVIPSPELLEENLYKDVMPATLEGCLVRTVDVLGYTPQDTHDLITAGFISEKDIPPNVKDQLGISISEIYNNLVLDVIYESSKAFEKGKKQICMSHKIFEALNELKDFNLRIILSKFGEYEKKTLHKNIIKLYRFYERVEDNFNFDKFTAMLVGMTDEILQNTIEGVNLAMARLREGKTQVGPMPSPEPPKDK